MREIILAKYGEMALKGANRSTFEDVLLRNIRYRLKYAGKFSYAKAQSTVYIIPETEDLLPIQLILLLLMAQTEHITIR